MLRELIGDDALKKAIRNYRSAADLQPAYMQSLVETPADPGLLISTWSGSSMIGFIAIRVWRSSRSILPIRASRS